MATNEKKEQLQDMMRKIETANGFRLIFLFIGVYMSLADEIKAKIMEAFNNKNK